MSQFFTVAGFVICFMFNILALLIQHWLVRARTLMSWNPVQIIDIRENLAGFKGDRINLSETAS